MYDCPINTINYHICTNIKYVHNLRSINLCKATSQNHENIIVKTHTFHPLKVYIRSVVHTQCCAYTVLYIHSVVHTQCSLT